MRMRRVVRLLMRCFFFYAFECGVKHLLFIWSDSEIDGESLGVFLIFVDMVFEEGHGCNLNLK